MTDDGDPPTNGPEDLGYRSPPPAVMPRPAHRKREPMARTPTPEEEPPKEEGPRSFSVLLQQVGDGDLHDELGLKMQELVAYLTGHSDRYQREAKGTLTLVLSVTAMGNGSLAVAGDIKSKTPTQKRAGSIFWRTPGNNLTVENPRQQKLPLKEVSLFASQKPKDISADPQPVRTV